MINFNEMRCHPTFIHADKTCAEHGYVLNRMYVENGAPWLSIYKKEQNSYHPAIYLSAKSAKCDDFKYEIQTASYGALDMESYKEFMKACADAHFLVELLSIIDFSIWPVLSDDGKEQ